MTEPLLTVQEVADLLGVGKTWVYEAVREGRIPHLRFGRSVRFRRDAIDAWLTERERRGA